jgi:ABC-type sugar transport system permease subunit
MKRVVLSDRTFATLLVVPVLAVLAAVMVFPFLQILRLSFFKYDVFAGGTTTFIGLENYRAMFQDPRFYNALWNTVKFTVITVSLQLLLGLGIATVLHKSFQGRTVIRVAVLLPWALPTIINSLLFRWMFDARFGVFNDILMRLHLVSRPVDWLVSAAGASFAIYFTQIWKMSSYMGLILLAGLQSIPSDLYEASRVDGASRWTQFLHITLPLLRPAITVAVIFRTVVALQVFDVVYAMTKGGPGIATETMVYNIYMQVFRYTEFGYGSTLSVFLSIVILVFGVLYARRLTRRESAVDLGG